MPALAKMHPMSPKVLSNKKAERIRKEADRRAKDHRTVIVVLIIVTIIIVTGIFVRIPLHNFIYHRDDSNQHVEPDAND